MTWTRGAAYGLTLIYSLGWVLIAPRRSVAQSCPGEQCPGDANCDGQVTIDEILTVVDEALNGCPMAISADEACTNVANAQCTKLDACVVNGTTSRYGSASVCQARQKQVCLRRLSATGTGNSASAVEQCAQQLATASCSDFDLSDVPDLSTEDRQPRRRAALRLPRTVPERELRHRDGYQLWDLRAAKPSRQLVRDDIVLDWLRVCEGNAAAAMPAAWNHRQRLRCGPSLWRRFFVRHSERNVNRHLSGGGQHPRGAV